MNNELNQDIEQLSKMVNVIVGQFNIIPQTWPSFMKSAAMNSVIECDILVEFDSRVKIGFLSECCKDMVFTIGNLRIATSLNSCNFSKYALIRYMREIIACLTFASSRGLSSDSLRLYFVIESEMSAGLVMKYGKHDIIVTDNGIYEYSPGCVRGNELPAINDNKEEK